MARNPMGIDPASYEEDPIFNNTTVPANNVNCRSGLFEACIPMPEVRHSHNKDLTFNMNLSYSCLTDNTGGLGDGWEFCFTIYSEKHEKLTLHTGETLELKKNEPLVHRVIRAEWNADGKLTIYFKGGRKEVLTKLGNSLYYVPETLTIDGYHYLTFAWLAVPHIIDNITYYQTKLKSIQDNVRTLIKIEYNINNDKEEVFIDYWPDDPAEQLRYTLEIDDYSLLSVTLANDIKTRCKYYDHMYAGWLLEEFYHPSGDVEKVVHSDAEIVFPGDEYLMQLPSVIEHSLTPNGGGPTIITKYRYNRVSNSEFYTTTKTLDENYNPITTTYTYNEETDEIISEVTTTALTTTKTVYDISADPNTIKNSRTITYSKSNKSRTLEIYNNFNKDGALTENIQRNIASFYDYQDGEIFPSERVIEEITTPTGLLDTPVKHKKHEYKRIAGTTVPKLTFTHENLTPSSFFETTIDKRLEYYEDNNFRKGQIKKIVYSGSLTKPEQSAEYELGGVNNSELTTKIIESLAGSTDKRIFSQTRSVLSGRITSQTDINGNLAKFTYDSFGRLTTHTLCAQSPIYKQTTNFSYPAPGQIKSIEPNGQTFLREYDGQDRLVREYEYLDSENRRLTQEVSYDTKGRELRTTLYDYLADGSQLTQWSENQYDEWGEVSVTTDSRGQKNYNYFDLVAMRRTEWTGKTFDKHKKVTTYNVDETIKKIEMYGLDGKIFQTQTATYTDERQIRQLKTENEFGVTTVTYSYDGFGRVVVEDHDERDKGVLVPVSYSYVYEYPPYSTTANEASSIGIRIGLSIYLLGERTFDAWGRVTSFTQGDATENYTYEGTSSVPATTTTADGTVLYHEYIKELDNKPKKISTSNPTQQQNFTYASATQFNSMASEGERLLQNTHDLRLRIIKQRAQTQPGQAKEVSSSYSSRGLLLTDTDALGTVTQFDYNSLGQRSSCSDQTLSTMFTYTDQGLLETEDIFNNQQGFPSGVNVSYKYDAKRRETSRRFSTPNDTLLDLEIITTYFPDDKLQSVQLRDNNLVVGTRNFTYSAVGRLKSCTTTGVWSPKNPKGKAINSQVFTYDEMGNIKRCVTTFVGGTNYASYSYDSKNCFRLKTIGNNHKDYKNYVELTYDIAGRLVKDQAGITYDYDWLGRLIRAGSSEYSYNAINHLMTRGENQIIYSERQLTGEYAQGANDDHQYLKPGSAGLTVERVRISGVDRTRLQLRDDHGTVWATHDVQAGTTKFYAYTPYGGRSSEQPESLLGAHGEPYESENGVYQLGNGCRVYAPDRSQFNKLDTLSPFGRGGPHAYGYCTEDSPINSHDPSGHFNVNNLLWEATNGGTLPAPVSMGEHAGVVITTLFAGIGVLLAIPSGGASLLLSGALLTLSGGSLITGVISELVAESDPELSKALGYASLFMGVAGGGASLVARMAQRAVTFGRFLGNTARAVGRRLFHRTAVVSSIAKAMSGTLRELPESLSRQLSKVQITTSPFNTKSLVTQVIELDLVSDLNTTTFAVTGLLELTGTLEDSPTARLVNKWVGNATWLPFGDFKSVFTMAR